MSGILSAFIGAKPAITTIAVEYLVVAGGAGGARGGGGGGAGGLRTGTLSVSKNASQTITVGAGGAGGAGFGAGGGV